MIAILNYILTVGIAAAASFRMIDGEGERFDFFGHGHTGLVLPLAALCAVLWLVLRSPPKRFKKKPPGAHLFLWPPAMVLLSRALFPNSVDDMQGVYNVLLAVSVALPALVRADLAWVAAFLFAAAFYTGQEVMKWQADIITEPHIKEDFLSFCFKLLESWALLLVVGLAPWWILKKRSEAREREFNATLEAVRADALSDAAERVRGIYAAQREPVKRATETGTVSMDSGTLRIDGAGADVTDTITMLNVGGKGVNEQLESMLFFMRYNFKGLTASAFMYDQAKRALVLNCYDAKDDVQIVNNAQIPIGVGVIGQVATSNKLFMSGDLSLYRGGELHYYAKAEDVRSIMAAPIIDRDSDGNGEFLGVLAVDSINEKAFSDRDRELMKRFAIIAAALLVNIRMRVSLEHSAKRNRALYEVSHSLSEALDIDEVFQVILKRIPEISPSCSRLIIIRHDQERNALRIQHIGGEAGELAEGTEFPSAPGGIYAWAFNKGELVNLNDSDVQALLAGRAYRFLPREQQNPLLRSLIVIPIIGGADRKCIGLFSAESATQGLFNPDLEQTLKTIIENASVAVTRSLLYMDMKMRATTDGLTGLNNHRTFQEIAAREFDRAKRYGRPLSMLLTDIDHFKKFNDTYGHPVGDLVLREIANCIKISVRANDYPARYGGEEFAVVLPETAEQGAMAIAERIRQTVEAKVIQSGQNMLRVTISIGCVTFPTYGTTQQEIIDCADKALYASKESGRNRVTLYNPSMRTGSK
jgi:diguanylate cyclase (GGDEF)-like protein